ncbi:hypothetical protein TWF481_012188 [Arthrobotrys musiformis]|uniref:DUF4396 domain-containing protein n=1 Tax=Arthrobotrys musiformis TaxID=47236 RepID=A0AAV9VZ71_9PEZI
MLLSRTNVVLKRNTFNPRCLIPTASIFRHAPIIKPQISQNTRWKCSSTSNKTTPTCPKTPQPSAQSAFEVGFWASRATWNRAMVNTFRCLVGCTAGDFSAMWYLQAFHPEIGIGSIMAISMASGLSTSLLLETVLLKYGRDKLPWPAAAKTAAGMSMISMLTMELVQNMVDYHLTGGNVQFESAAFWVAAAVSMSAGFLAPLPYNYHRLRRYGRGCH